MYFSYFSGNVSSSFLNIFFTWNLFIASTENISKVGALGSSKFCCPVQTIHYDEGHGKNTNEDKILSQCTISIYFFQLIMFSINKYVLLMHKSRATIVAQYGKDCEFSMVSVFFFFDFNLNQTGNEKLTGCTRTSS